MPPVTNAFEHLPDEAHAGSATSGLPTDRSRFGGATSLILLHRVGRVCARSSTGGRYQGESGPRTIRSRQAATRLIMISPRALARPAAVDTEV